MRKRELSPTFWRDERVWKLTHHAKLLYLGLFGVADRAGRMLDKPFEIGVEVWPWAPMEASALIDEIVNVGLICRYEVRGQRLLAFPKVAWAKHQRLHPKERPSILPANPLEVQVAEGAPQGSPRSSPGITQVDPSREKVVPDRAGSSGPSGSSETVGIDQDRRDRSGSSGEQMPLVPGEPGEEKPAKQRKPSVWEDLWREKLAPDRLVQIAANQNSKVSDADFDLYAHEIHPTSQQLNTLLKKAALDLEREFSGGTEWTLEQRLEAVESAWTGYLGSAWAATIDPPYALNAFASPKVTIPGYKRARAS